MRNEFTPKEKDMAEFVAMLTGKTVYFDNQKNKYILASKDKINQLVKISYNNNDYIKANELLESANKVFSTDIKNVFRSVVSKSMRLKTSVFLSLLNQANNSAVSISDVMRKKIILYLKDELEKLDITDENKSLLKQSLSVWDNRKSVKHKDNYLDSFFICDILSSERSIEIIREIPHYSVIDGGELENAITVYAKAIFKSYLKNLDFSNDQINHVLSFYGNASIVPDDVFFSITESEKKNTDLLLVADIDIRHYFHNILQMKESFPIKSKTKRGFDLKEMKVLNNFIKTFSVLDSDSEDNTDESVFDES
ncbi:MAG: hypothetical protein U9Q97_07690, partial [Acidobacteriota bacterium]|nr:hypothetical protein [Acidobacteriota bacterium]